MIKLQKLRRLNIAAGFLHLFQGILMVWLTYSADLDAKYGLTTSFLQFNTEGGGLSIIREKVLEYPIGYGVSVFLFMSAIAHFFVSTIGYDWYKEMIKSGVNYARWYEYAASSSWMIIIIGILVGMFDLPSLILLMFLNASMIFFGDLMERMNKGRDRIDWTAFIYGCIAGIVPWIVLGWYFYGAISNTSADAEVPTFVYAIFFSLFTFFNIFAINMYLQYKKFGKWSDYRFGEIMYIVLSLLAKSALAWQVWSGTLRPEN